MATCATCGNDYDKAFTVTMGDETYAFDAFECAIQKLAPRCMRCGCTVIGHGVESDSRIYCSAQCAAGQGIGNLRDRA